MHAAHPDGQVGQIHFGHRKRYSCCLSLTCCYEILVGSMARELPVVELSSVAADREQARNAEFTTSSRICAQVDCSLYTVWTVCSVLLVWHGIL